METTIKLDEMKVGDLAILAFVFSENNMPDESLAALDVLIALIGENEVGGILTATMKAVKDIRKM